MFKRSKNDSGREQKVEREEMEKTEHLEKMRKEREKENHLEFEKWMQKNDFRMENIGYAYVEFLDRSITSFLVDKTVWGRVSVELRKGIWLKTLQKWEDENTWEKERVRTDESFFRLSRMCKFGFRTLVPSDGLNLMDIFVSGVMRGTIMEWAILSDSDVRFTTS